LGKFEDNIFLLPIVWKIDFLEKTLYTEKKIFRIFWNIRKYTYLCGVDIQTTKKLWTNI
jgi:hypothetical protein